MHHEEIASTFLKKCEDKKLMYQGKNICRHFLKMRKRKKVESKHEFLADTFWHFGHEFLGNYT